MLNFKQLVSLLAGVLLVLVAHFGINDRLDNSEQPSIDGVVYSRIWMEYAMDLVRYNPTTPPRSARLYAYVASVYYDVLVVTGSEDEAGMAARDLINKLVPVSEHDTNLFYENISGSDITDLSNEAKSIVDKFIERSNSDGASQVWVGENQLGDGYWSGSEPFEPLAGEWRRWVIGGAKFNVPPPPQWGSDEHVSALALVKKTAKERTNEQSAAVNFWGGVPGTEAPAGIWQNVMYDKVREQGLSDLEYAYAQMLLAQGIADSFIECWALKYKYWTARPSMDDESIVPFMDMDNPNFPSYASGHSTVSRTAAGVLAFIFPASKDFWMSNAEEARDSRLWAGVHFAYDNEIGFEHGKDIADEFIRRFSLEPTY